MKTFIHHDGALGDALLSLPCIAALKAGSEHLEIAGRRDVTEFLKEAGFVNAALSSDNRLFASLYGGTDLNLRQYLHKFDRAFIFTAQSDSQAADLVRSIIPLTYVIRTVPDDDRGGHASEFRLSQLARTVPVPENPLLVDLDREFPDQAELFLRDNGFDRGRLLLAAHPGSGGIGKCWPLERYFELIERLQSLYDPCTIIFSGYAESGTLKSRIDGFVRARKGALHAADFKLITAAALLSRCDLYVGNDSGFSHLAASVCPALVLFGPTDPERWKPRGRHVEVISGERRTMSAITVDEVTEKSSRLAAGKRSRDLAEKIFVPMKGVKEPRAEKR